jgi:hypothetical protein
MKRVVAAALGFILAGNVVYACNSDDDGDGGTGGHAVGCDDAGMTGDSPSPGADAPSDGPPAGGDAGHASDAGDAGDAGHASDAGDAGDAGPQPVVLDLCGTFDAMWPAGLARENAASWPTEFINGPPVNNGHGYWGLINADCNIGSILANLPLSDYGPWMTQLETFEYQLFGCPIAGTNWASIGFPLVPPYLYGQPLSSTDLQRLSDWYLEAVIQLVADQAVAAEPLPFTDASLAPGLLTIDQIESISQALTYAQTLYPNTVVSASFSQSLCVAASAGADAGSAGADAGADGG